MGLHVRHIEDDHKKLMAENEILRVAKQEIINHGMTLLCPKRYAKETKNLKESTREQMPRNCIEK